MSTLAVVLLLALAVTGLASPVVITPSSTGLVLVPTNASQPVFFEFSGFSPFSSLNFTAVFQSSNAANGGNTTSANITFPSASVFTGFQWDFDGTGQFNTTNGSEMVAGVSVLSDVPGPDAPIDVTFDIVQTLTVRLMRSANLRVFVNNKHMVASDFSSATADLSNTSSLVVVEADAERRELMIDIEDAWKTWPINSSSNIEIYRHPCANRSWCDQVQVHGHYTLNSSVFADHSTSDWDVQGDAHARRSVYLNFGYYHDGLATAAYGRLSHGESYTDRPPVMIVSPFVPYEYMAFRVSIAGVEYKFLTHWVSFFNDSQSVVRVGFSYHDVVPVDFNRPGDPVPPGLPVVSADGFATQSLPITIWTGSDGSPSVEPPVLTVRPCVSSSNCSTTKFSRVSVLLSDWSNKLGFGEQRFYLNRFGTFGDGGNIVVSSIMPVLSSALANETTLFRIDISTHHGFASSFILDYSFKSPSLGIEDDLARCSGRGVWDSTSSACVCYFNNDGTITGTDCSVYVDECSTNKCMSRGVCDPVTADCICNAVGANSTLNCTQCFPGFLPDPDPVLHCVNCQPGLYGTHCNYSDPQAASAFDGMCNETQGNRTSLNLDVVCACEPGFWGATCSMTTQQANDIFCTGSNGTATNDGFQGGNVTMGDQYVTLTQCICNPGRVGLACELTECPEGPRHNITNNCMSCIDGVVPTVVNGVLYCMDCVPGRHGVFCNSTNATSLRASMCNNNGQPNGTTCICDPPFSGDFCADTNCPTAACDPSETCMALQLTLPRLVQTPEKTRITSKCVCTPNGTNLTCYYNYMARPDLCSNHGFMNGTRTECDCDPGWYTYYVDGEWPAVGVDVFCNVPQYQCDAIKCNRRGTCVDDLETPAGGLWGIRCDCQEGASGPGCEFVAGECAATRCSSHGECVASVATGVFDHCLCDSGFTGDSCEVATFANWMNVSLAGGSSDPFTVVMSSASPASDGTLRTSTGEFSVDIAPNTTTRLAPPNDTAIGDSATFNNTGGAFVQPQQITHRVGSRLEAKNKIMARLMTAGTGVSVDIRCVTGELTTARSPLQITASASAGFCLNTTSPGVCDDSTVSIEQAIADTISHCSVLLLNSSTYGSQSVLMVVDNTTRPWSDLRIQFSTRNTTADLFSVASGFEVANAFFSKDGLYLYVLTHTPGYHASDCPAEFVNCPTLYTGRASVDIFKLKNDSSGDPEYVTTQDNLQALGLPLLAHESRFSQDVDRLLIGGVSGYTTVVGRDPSTGLLVTNAASSYGVPIVGPLIGKSDQVLARVRNSTLLGLVTISSNGAIVFPYRIDMATFDQSPATSVQTVTTTPSPSGVVVPSISTPVASVIIGETIMVVVGTTVSGEWVSTMCKSRSSIFDPLSESFCDPLQLGIGQLDDGLAVQTGIIPVTGETVARVDNPRLQDTTFLSVAPQYMDLPQNNRWGLAVVRRSAVSVFSVYTETDRGIAILPTGFGSQHVRTFRFPSTNRCVQGHFSPNGRFFAVACGEVVRVFFVFPSMWLDPLYVHPTTNATTVVFSPDSTRLYAVDQGEQKLIKFGELESPLTAGSASITVVDVDNTTRVATVAVTLPVMVPDGSVSLVLYDEGVIIPGDATARHTIALSSVYHSGTTTVQFQVPVYGNYSAFLSIQATPTQVSTLTAAQPVALLVVNQTQITGGGTGGGTTGVPPPQKYTSDETALMIEVWIVVALVSVISVTAIVAWAYPRAVELGGNLKERQVQRADAKKAAEVRRLTEENGLEFDDGL